MAQDQKPGAPRAPDTSPMVEILVARGRSILHSKVFYNQGEAVSLPEADAALHRARGFVAEAAGAIEVRRVTGDTAVIRAR